MITFLIIGMSTIALGKQVKTSGKGFGFKDYVEVEVTSENGRILGIVVTDHGDTEKYAKGAFKNMTKSIIKAQSTDVDLIAGATGSSMGIKLAVEDALK